MAHRLQSSSPGKHSALITLYLPPCTVGMAFLGCSKEGGQSQEATSELVPGHGSVSNLHCPLVVPKQYLT